MLLFGRIINKKFRATANIQLHKFRFQEGLKLVKYQFRKLISFVYSKLWIMGGFGGLLSLSFQKHRNNRFFKTSFNQVWSSSAPAPSVIIWRRCGTINCSGNFVFKGCYTCRIIYKLNYFASQEAKFVEFSLKQR